MLRASTWLVLISVAACTRGAAPPPPDAGAPTPRAEPSPSARAQSSTTAELIDGDRVFEAARAGAPALAAATRARWAEAEARWQEVSARARDPAVPVAERQAALRALIVSLDVAHPRRREAMARMLALEAEAAPWAKSTHAGLELQRTEVTVAAYQACVRAGACAPGEAPRGEGCSRDIAGREHYPVDCLTRAEAEAYCRFVGGRLPTVAQWRAEATAGGTRGYPWGPETTTCDFAVMFVPLGTGADEWRTTGGCGAGHAAEVCDRPRGLSASGLCDLAGNVWEWTRDDADGLAVVVGGSWKGSAPGVVPTAYDAEARAAEARSADVGLRCVR